ncbi:STAS/SEC14 domain-containing protein [Maliponia aquimaris]|uniref:STAS/SEC14 domain-containing protein n=1 Tax=Maliponia aquimaris TaxID=1673631 RepID=A0A238K723_9RHOB|nr:STAS/SEC14 domain-containing protein [Maliponia aquimaris]SMX38603.1 hypothetical protein MAA8898_01626 [Maliponia aquimaris]
MLTVNELKPRVFEITLSGTVEAADIEVLKRALTPALEAEGKMGLVLRMEDLDDITGDALIRDARFEVSMLPQWSKVGRVAVVTDKQAFEALLNWFDPILPMIEFRTFAPAGADAARDWAADLPRAKSDAAPGVRIVEDGSDGLMVFEIVGKMQKDDADRVFAAFDSAVARHGKINLMVRVKNYEGFDLGLLGDRETMTSKFGAIGKVGRYAVVGAPGWMRAVVQGMAPLLPIEMRAFEASEDDQALAWARAA